MSEPNRSQPHQQRVQTHFGGEPAYEDVERHPLVDAVRDGRRNDVAYILTGGTTPDVGNNRIGTPLYWAAERGHREIAQLLIDAGADVNATTFNGRTPLHVAATRPVAELLIVQRANIEAMDAQGNTPLMTQIESAEMASLLLINGASPLNMNNTGVMALHLATDNPGLTKDLLDRGAPLNARESRGRTALHFAIEKSNLPTIEILLMQGADLSIEDGASRTPIQLAIELEHTEAIITLIEIGEDLTSMMELGVPLRRYAKKKGRTDLLKTLKKHRIGTGMVAWLKTKFGKK